MTGEGNGELFSGDRVSVSQDGKVLELLQEKSRVNSPVLYT